MSELVKSSGRMSSMETEHVWQIQYRKKSQTIIRTKPMYQGFGVQNVKTTVDVPPGPWQCLFPLKHDTLEECIVVFQTSVRPAADNSLPFADVYEYRFFNQRTEEAIPSDLIT